MENVSLGLLSQKYNVPSLVELQNTFPVPVGVICEQLGIKIYELPLSDDISGRVYREDNSYFIETNLRQVQTRRRFTIAHELGHYCLHKDFLDISGMILERSTMSEVIKDKEYEADDFAAELLMPKQHFVEKYNQSSNISELSKYFMVSSAAVRVRLNSLSIY